jgi:hypothetical protein
MLKRDKLKRMLKKISDNEFDAVWKGAYGYIPSGERSELVTEFVAEQYDGELDGCIALAQSFLKSTPKPKPNRWLAPR